MKFLETFLYPTVEKTTLKNIGFLGTTYVIKYKDNNILYKFKNTWFFFSFETTKFIKIFFLFGIYSNYFLFAHFQISIFFSIGITYINTYLNIIYYLISNIL